MKRVLSFALVFMFMSGIFALGEISPVSATTYSGECGESLTWTLDTDTGVLEISGTGAMQNYIGSSSPWYNYRESIGSVVLSDGVTSIGDSAFSWCSSLVSVEIPDSVTYIGNNAFSRCSSLERLEIPNSVTYIGDSAFRFCSSLANVEISDSVTSIGNGAFYGCSSLANVDVNVKNNYYMSNDGVLYNKNQTSILYYPTGKIGIEFRIPDSVTSIGYGAFDYCSSLVSVEIPDSVTSIGDCAFIGCSSLVSVEIPDGVTSIGNNAFDICSNLVRVEIPNSVTSIGIRAFYGCSSLASVEVPNSVTSIGEWAFTACIALYKVYFNSAVPPTVVTGAFNNIKSDAHAIVPASWGENSVAEGSTWNGLIIEYKQVCEYCKQDPCVCLIIFKDELEELLEEDINIESGFVKGITECTEVSSLDNMGNIKILDKLGVEINAENPYDYLGTGMTIIIGKEKILVIIENDLTGDGDPDIEDAQIFLESLVGNTTLDGAYKEAVKHYDDTSALKQLREFLTNIR